jgi:hypothetical protein
MAIRHHHVEQDDVALGLFADRQRFAAAHGGDDVEIFRRQARFQELDVGRNVIDDENARCHDPNSSGIAKKMPNGLNELAD